MTNYTAIGIRVSPQVIYFSVLTNDGNIISHIATDSVICPKSFNVPEKLRFVRNTFLDILDLYSVNLAGIRIQESTAQSSNTDRLNFEAVLQEMLASSSVEHYFLGQISSISKRLGINRADFSLLVNDQISSNAPSGGNFLSFIKDCWKDIKKIEERESLLVAIGVLNDV